MRFSLLILAVAVVVNAGVLSGSKEPDLQVSINFSSKNVGKKVFNGHSENLLLVRAVNLAGEQLIISSIHSHFYQLGGILEREKPLKNSTNLPLRQVVLPGLATPTIKYKFHSEQKPGKVGLKVYVEYNDAGNRPHSQLGFKGEVNIVEPKKKAFDFQVISLYIMLAAVLAALVYNYSSFFTPTLESIAEQAKPLVPSITELKSTKSTKTKAATKEKAVESATEWIPDELLRARKGRKNQGNGGN